MHKYIIIYALVITAALLVAVSSCNRIKKEKNRLDDNQTALLTDIEYFKTENGKNAAKVIQLEMSKGEIEKLLKEKADEVKNLNIKLKRLESLTTAGTKTEIEAKAHIKDSVVIRYVDSIKYVEQVKTFEWSDQWSNINGIIYQDSVECKYKSVDTLNIVCHRVPKKFLFIKYGTKYIETVVTNANPNTQIVYMESIRLKK